MLYYNIYNVDYFKKLEINKLIKELDYVQSDFRFKSELLSHLDTEFIKNVNLFLEEHPELKSIFDEKIKLDIDEKIDNQISNIIDSNDVIDSSNSKIKQLYRTIVKLTHPDKKNDLYLNSLYIEAQKAYESNNLLELISICSKLEIPFDISDDEVDKLKDEIYTIKNKSNFLENTFTWNWYNQEDEKRKKMIILSYIEKQIT